KSSARIRDAVKRTGPGIQRLLQEHSFEMAFIMLGTNDLSQSEDEEIFSAIQGIHEECHRRNVFTLALAVPPSAAATKLQDISATRQGVNRRLQKWAAGNSKTHFIDTDRLLPFQRDSELWELDGLHFSRKGSQ
ncbi:unnamed protein product, partial [Effrenium voratum]